MPFIQVNYFLSDFDSIWESAFDKFYLLTHVGGSQQVYITEAVNEGIRSVETRHLNEVILTILQKFKGQVSFVFRHFPLTQVHQKAHKAAEAAIAAGQEGKFWEMHQQLLQHPKELGLISLKKHAREVGVLDKRFLDRLMNGDFGWFVQDDLREGLKRGVRDIPALFVNGTRMDLPLTIARINKRIREELETAASDASNGSRAAA